MNDADERMEKKRMRSPAYPVIPLGEALECVQKMWDSQRKHEAHIDSALKAIGYARHGASLRIIAALNHYGLTEETGSKDDRKIRISEVAQDIILLPQSDPRRTKALKAAAIAPAIHAALWERYGPQLPTDSSIRPYLIRDKNYNESIVGDVVANYRASLELAELDKLDDANLDQQSVISESPETAKPMKTEPPPPLQAKLHSEDHELPIWWE